MSSEGRKSDEKGGGGENTAGGGGRTEVSSQTSAFQSAVAAWRGLFSLLFLPLTSSWMR